MLMKRATIARLAMAAALSIALVATACNDDDDGDGGATATPGAPSTPGTSGPGPTASSGGTEACDLRDASDGLALVVGPSFQLGEAVWQLCIGGAGAGSSEKYLFRSEDGGATWDLISQTTPGDIMPDDDDDSDLPIGNAAEVIYFVDEDNGWIGLSSPGPNLHRSQDGGETWTAIDDLPPAVPVTSIAFTDAQNGTVTTSESTWTTSDGGDTWVETP